MVRYYLNSKRLNMELRKYSGTETELSQKLGMYDWVWRAAKSGFFPIAPHSLRILSTALHVKSKELVARGTRFNDDSADFSDISRSNQMRTRRMW